MLFNLREWLNQYRSNRYAQKITALCVVFMLFFSIFSVQVFAAAANNNGKTRTVRVGYFLVDGFQEYNAETKTYSGYGYEFLMALAAYTNWRYEFVHCATFSEAFEKLEKGEVDLMNDLAKVEGRNVEYSNLSAGNGCSYLMMHDGDNSVPFNDWEGIGKLKIGLDKGSGHSKRLLAILSEHSVSPQVVWYEDEGALISAWKEGQVDAFPAHSDTAIDGHAVMIFDPRMYYLATTKGNKELINEADYAIQALRANNSGFEATIYDKYYNRIGRNYTALNKEELAYVKAHPVVRVLYIPNWYPISYQDKNGNFTGPFKKIYDLLQERTGLKFEFVPLEKDKPFKGIVESYNCYMLAEHPADYTGAAFYDVKLTQTFVNAALVEVSKGTLKKGDTIALVKGDSLSEVAKRLFGDNFKYSMEKNIDECINKVQDGTVDGTILMSYESEYYQSQRKYRNLIYTVVNSGSYGFALAVSNKADPLLYSIIVKGLNAINPGEVNNIFNQMTQELRKHTLWDTVLDNPLPFILGGIVLVALLVLLGAGYYFSRKIKEKNEQLIHANAATNQFFASMSHDMRTPMNGILGIAALSKDDNDVETLHEEMEKIRQSGKYLLSLINDTLDFQRIESGNLKIEKELVNYRAVLENIADLVTQTAQTKNINLSILCEENVPDCYIWADPVRLKQIFVNLLSNAIKFTPAGGTVTVEYVSKHEEAENLSGRFYVRDTGIGMSQDFIQTRMFHPFNQEHNVVTGQYAGSGLGLSIVKSLVDIMGGTIQVESEVGKGTTFIVELDFVKATAEELKQLAEKEKNDNGNPIHIHSIKGRKILLAEDHPLNAEIAKRLLTKAGCEIQWAKNGQEVLDTFNNSPKAYFDIILMDVRMPIMNGLEATKAIRALTREDAKTIPIIAMTANAYESDIKECLAAGMTEHISKPIEPQKLFAVISRNC